MWVGKVSPDPLIIDFDPISTAPRDLNIAGVGDILSIHTATYDWELAHKVGKSEYPFSPDDIRNVVKSGACIQKVLTRELKKAAMLSVKIIIIQTPMINK